MSTKVIAAGLIMFVVAFWGGTALLILGLPAIF